MTLPLCIYAPPLPTSLPRFFPLPCPSPSAYMPRPQVPPPPPCPAPAPQRPGVERVNSRCDCRNTGRTKAPLRRPWRSGAAQDPLTEPPPLLPSPPLVRTTGAVFPSSPLLFLSSSSSHSLPFFSAVQTRLLCPGGRLRESRGLSGMSSPPPELQQVEDGRKMKGGKRGERRENSPETSAVGGKNKANKATKVERPIHCLKKQNKERPR